MAVGFSKVLRWIGPTGRLAVPLFMVAAICLVTDRSHDYIGFHDIVVMALACPIGWLFLWLSVPLAELVFPANSTAVMMIRHVAGMIGLAANTYLLAAIMLFLTRKRPAQPTHVTETELEKLLDDHHRQNKHGTCE
jgi:hypothetical protein